eukprot:TRINITY_DN19761_c0_g1_i1.p1 TRINITY_DN19761_c0_g1~~TRINITY_DN19761_c0_g1_i1.p1  ORF type:complete len:362 (+),score=54.91 TRINITY_DN19761_c0_g1_i1:48-1133(+)
MATDFEESSDPGSARCLQSKGAIALAVISAFTAVVAAMLALVPELSASGMLAYTFGLRHAVDADHIAAIDNVTRRLTTGNRRPATVGLFFALGHSTVVTLMCLIVVFARDFVQKHMETFSNIGGVAGASISGSFLLVVGAMNVFAEVQLWRSWKEQSRYGTHTHAVAGLCIGCCPKLFEGITEPWHMLPIGFLFGLGFDTSSEVGLLGVVAISNGLAHPVAIMLLPLLFMAGMCLIDTLNGILMAWVYSKALEDNLQKLYYNLFLTTTSGLIALTVGSIELLGVIAVSAKLHGWFWDQVSSVLDHFEVLGVVVIGGFMLSFIVALICFRRVFPAGKENEEPIRRELIRYPDSGEYVDRADI